MAASDNFKYVTKLSYKPLQLVTSVGNIFAFIFSTAVQPGIHMLLVAGLCTYTLYIL